MLKGKTSSITYDQAGQTLSRTSKDGTEQFEWDPWGNLIAIQTPNYTWKASYDPFGRRLQTTYTQKGILWNTSLKTTSLFDPEHEFQEIGVKYNNNTFWKLYGPTSCDALIDSAGNTLGLLQDALSNLWAIVSQDHTHWIEELSSPYGPTGPPLTLEPDLLTYAKSLSWQDNKLDPTGLIHLGARYYDPKTGRFLSPDPISYPTCLDLYSYANGDPVNFRDPSGRFASHALETIPHLTLSSLNARADLGSQIRNFAPGILQGGAGLTEMGSGAAFIATAASMSNPISAGATALIGIGGVLHGWDNYSTGAQQVFSGSYQSSSTVEFLKGLGFSEQFAEGIHGTATMLFSSGISLNQAERFATRELAKNSRLHLETFPSKDFHLNRFHQAASNLTEVGQNNIRILRSWAKSKGWERLPNPKGGPEAWGKFDKSSNQFKWFLKIKPESSLRNGLQPGSAIPRASARLEERVYINPFTSQKGGADQGNRMKKFLYIHGNTQKFQPIVWI